MMNGLFRDLAYYGITPPLHVDKAIQERTTSATPKGECGLGERVAAWLRVEAFR